MNRNWVFDFFAAILTPTAFLFLSGATSVGAGSSAEQFVAKANEACIQYGKQKKLDRRFVVHEQGHGPEFEIATYTNGICLCTAKFYVQDKPGIINRESHGQSIRDARSTLECEVTKFFGLNQFGDIVFLSSGSVFRRFDEEPDDILIRYSEKLVEAIRATQ